MVLLIMNIVPPFYVELPSDPMVQQELLIQELETNMLQLQEVLSVVRTQHRDMEEKQKR